MRFDPVTGDVIRTLPRKNTIFNASRGWKPQKHCKSIEALGFELGLSGKNSRTECEKDDTIVEYICRGFYSKRSGADWRPFESKYRNPHRMQWGTNTVTNQPYTLDEAIGYYKDDIFGECPEVQKYPALAKSHKLPSAKTIKNELKGRKLMCWCSATDRPHYVGEKVKGDVCHGDILASIANE